MYFSRTVFRRSLVVSLSGGALAVGMVRLAARDFAGRQDDTAQQLIAELGCAACHAGVAATAETVRGYAPSLSDAGSRYVPSRVFSYLQNPERVRQNIGATRMPSFALNERESLALTLYLQTLDGSIADGSSREDDFTRHFERKSRSELRAIDRSFTRSRRANDDVTSQTGAKLFAAFNCAGCHNTEGVQPLVVGPDLSTIGRLQSNWLAEYIRSPVAIRVFGFHPGSGARMPNFSLSEDEARLLTGHLLTATREPDLTTFEPIRLSAFSEDKALRLVRDRLACLGCHRLRGEGGRIGPDLSNVGARLTPPSIHAMLTAPQRQAPGSIMPHRPMPADRIDLIASFLTAQIAPTTDIYVSPLDYETVSPTVGGSGGELYARFCASCHGIAGEGDGFNAVFLPVVPTAHADSAHMSTRPDDTLFDGVHAGAYILGKSHRMPAFGQRLTSDEIRSIVAYMRDLCRCVGPAWSRDGRGS